MFVVVGNPLGRLGPRQNFWARQSSLLIGSSAALSAVMPEYGPTTYRIQCRAGLGLRNYTRRIEASTSAQVQGIVVDQVFLA